MWKKRVLECNYSLNLCFLFCRELNYPSFNFLGFGGLPVWSCSCCHRTVLILHSQKFYGKLSELKCDSLLNLRLKTVLNNVCFCYSPPAEIDKNAIYNRRKKLRCKHWLFCSTVIIFLMMEQLLFKQLILNEFFLTLVISLTITKFLLHSFPFENIKTTCGSIMPLSR